MSIDTLGQRSAEDLRTAASEIDVERSLRDAVGRERPAWRWTTVLVAATVVLVLVVVWAGSSVMTDEQSAPPLDSAPAEIVGRGVSVDIQATVPEGWEVVRDAQTVELRPLDGSDSAITMVGQPVKVYEPPDYRLKPLREDLVVWTTTHPDLEVTYKWGLDGPNFAWHGTEMRLGLKRGNETPLVPLPSGTTPLAISDADQTFLWDVIYLSDSPPLLVASRSPSADDPVLKAARDELLQSLTITTPSN